MSNEYDIQTLNKINSRIVPTLSGMQTSLNTIDDMPATVLTIDSNVNDLLTV